MIIEILPPPPPSPGGGRFLLFYFFFILLACNAAACVICATSYSACAHVQTPISRDNDRSNTSKREQIPYMMAHCS